MKPKNLKAFKALIIRYETITMKEIVEKKANPNKLTGFGSDRTCSLCKGILNCHGCIYSLFGVACVISKTFNHICEASGNPAKLLKAYWLRAKYMRDILKQLNYKQP